MRRTTPALVVVFLAIVLTVTSFGAAQGKKTAAVSRPGDAPFTPTKLQWAALELQASYGVTTISNDGPAMVNFIAQPDGETIICLIQYMPDTPAAAVKITRDSERRVFDGYVVSTGWTWLHLKFQESVLPATSN